MVRELWEWKGGYCYFVCVIKCDICTEARRKREEWAMWIYKEDTYQLRVFKTSAKALRQSMPGLSRDEWGDQSSKSRVGEGRMWKERGERGSLGGMTQGLGDRYGMAGFYSGWNRKPLKDSEQGSHMSNLHFEDSFWLLWGRGVVALGQKCRGQLGSWERGWWPRGGCSSGPWETVGLYILNIELKRSDDGLDEQYKGK